MKKYLDSLKNEAVKEFYYLDKTTNLEFEGKETNFLKDITSAKSIKELNNIRNDMLLAYSYSILDFTENMIDSFCNSLADVREYNEKFMNLGQKVDKIAKLEQINEKEIKEGKELFTEIWNFYITVQKNEKNIANQSKKEFWFKLYPIWAGIFSLAYIYLIGLLIAQQKVIWSWLNLVWIVGGWFLLIVIVGVFLKVLVYGIRRKKS